MRRFLQRIGSALAGLPSTTSGPQETGFAAGSREALARLGERLAVLEDVIAAQASSIDEQLQDHEIRLTALGGELWYHCPTAEPSPSRFETLELALSRQMQAVGSQAQAQAQAGQQIADLLAGLEALSRVYGDRLNLLQSAFDAMGQGAISVQAAQLRTEIEQVRVFHESAMSRLATAEATFRTLQEQHASSPLRTALTAHGSRTIVGDTREGRAAGVAMDLHGLVRAAARRQPEALKAIDVFAAAFASMSDEVEALRRDDSARMRPSRLAFPAMGDTVEPVPALSIMSIGERGFGADGEAYACLIEAGAAAMVHRVVGDEDVPEAPALDFLLIQDAGRALDAIEEVGASIDSVLAVQCRVSFAATLDGGDMFAEVDQDLQSLGFQLVDLIRTGRDSFDAVADASSRSRLLWADAVYIRRFEGTRPLSPDAMLRAAFLVHMVYGMYDLASRLLAQRDVVTGGGSSIAYAAALAASPGHSPASRGR